MQSVTNGLLTTYETLGSGKDVLLIHGWGDDHRTFQSLGQALAESYRVTALDLPGFGASEPPREVWGLDEYVAFVKGFVEKQGVSPYAVIAHSNGGAVAIKAVANGVLHPDRLVLLASAGIRDRQKLRRFLLKLVAKIGKVVTFWLPKSQKRKLREKLYGAAGSDLHVVPHLQETFKKTVRQDVQDDARRLELPVLLIYGSADTATPPLYGRIYKGLIKNASLQTLEDAGHFVHHDKPEAVSAAIKDFLHA